MASVLFCCCACLTCTVESLYFPQSRIANTSSKLLMSSVLSLARAVRTAVPTVLFSSIVYSVAGDSLFGLFTISGRRLAERHKVVLRCGFLAFDLVFISVAAVKLLGSCPFWGNVSALSSTNSDCYPIVACSFVFSLVVMWIDRCRCAFLDGSKEKTSMMERVLVASVVAVGWLGLVERDSFCIVDLFVFTIQRRIFPNRVSLPCQCICILLGLVALASGMSRKPAAIAILSCLGDLVTRTSTRQPPDRPMHVYTK